MTDLYALYAELLRREEADARVWSLFQHLDFVNQGHAAQALAEHVAASLQLPLSNKLRKRVSDVLLAHGIVKLVHSGNVVFRHADWRRLTKLQREQERLDAMEPIDRRILELTEARKQKAKATKA